MAWSYTSNTYDGRYLRLDISETVNKSSNSSTLTWTLTSAGGSVNYYTIGTTTVTINGTQVYYKAQTGWSTQTFPAAKGSTSGTLTIKHNADGTKTGVSVSFKTRVYIYEPLEWAGGTINLTNIATYTLSVSAGTGSSITVNRTSSGYGGTGNLSNGARLYYGDKLKVTFTASSNYQIATHTVNGSSFTSGNTHSVTGNVSVVATAQVLASSVGATNANIGSVSTITVTKYSSSYYHSLQYKFGNLSGYITSSGGTSTTESKFSSTSVAFTVPTTFYAQIPNAKTGTCTITCRTYSSSSSTTVLGTAKTCTFTVTASSANCAPTVSGTVVDTNSSTITLTGDSSKLIRYKSTALCTITATAKNSASISSRTINDVSVTSTRTFSSVSTTSFKFSATDSRGYTTSTTRTPTMIAYVNLTCNPTIIRPSPTEGTIVMSFNGNVYRGSFGAYSNTLTLKYRYRESTSSTYTAWQTVASTNIIYGTSSYSSNKSINLGDEFDYQKSYVFQVQATDGGGGVTLSSVTQTVTVERGIPVFDWGSDDFNVNGDLKLNNVSILNIMYPVGSVYMHSSSTLPTAISNIGTWTSLTTGITGVYGWKRTN